MLLMSTVYAQILVLCRSALRKSLYALMQSDAENQRQNLLFHVIVAKCPPRRKEDSEKRHHLKVNGGPPSVQGL